MAKTVISEMFLEELIEKQIIKDREIQGKIDSKFNKCIVFNNFSKDEMVQLEIMYAEMYIYDDNKIIDVFNDTHTTLKKNKNLKKKIENVIDNLKIEDYVKNLYVCPEMQFLYDNGFLEFKEDEIIINRKKLFAYDVLKEYLIFELVEIVLNFIEEKRPFWFSK
jgi:hypothetical protein